MDGTARVHVRDWGIRKLADALGASRRALQSYSTFSLLGSALYVDDRRQRTIGRTKSDAGRGSPSGQTPGGSAVSYSGLAVLRELLTLSLLEDTRFTRHIGGEKKIA